MKHQIKNYWLQIQWYHRAQSVCFQYMFRPKIYLLSIDPHHTMIVMNVTILAASSFLSVSLSIPSHCFHTLSKCFTSRANFDTVDMPTVANGMRNSETDTRVFICRAQYDRIYDDNAHRATCTHSNRIHCKLTCS